MTWEEANRLVGEYTIKLLEAERKSSGECGESYDDLIAAFEAGALRVRIVKLMIGKRDG